MVLLGSSIPQKTMHSKKIKFILYSEAFTWHRWQDSIDSAIFQMFSDKDNLY